MSTTFNSGCPGPSQIFSKPMFSNADLKSSESKVGSVFPKNAVAAITDRQTTKKKGFKCRFENFRKQSGLSFSIKCNPSILEGHVQF